MSIKTGDVFTYKGAFAKYLALADAEPCPVMHGRVIVYAFRLAGCGYPDRPYVRIRLRAEGQAQVLLWVPEGWFPCK